MRRFALACASAVCAVIALGPAASAHEHRQIGAYSLEIGFLDEPAYTGIKNGAEILLHDSADKPVRDLGDTLKVEVIFGAEKMPAMTLQPAFGEEFGTPGNYRAYFFPTRPGKYTFHIFGTIKGQAVDESFTSSPTGFSEVKDATAVQFPVKDPSNAQLGESVARLGPRVEAAAKKGKADTDQVRILAIIGLALGAVGVIGAIFAAKRS
jgi:hypothetical protein